MYHKMFFPFTKAPGDTYPSTPKLTHTLSIFFLALKTLSLPRADSE